MVFRYNVLRRQFLLAPLAVLTSCKLHLMLKATDYGLVGDGVSANDAAFASFMQAVAAAGGGEAYFPSGRYRFNGTIGPIPQNTWLRGEACGSNGGTEGTVFEFYGAASGLQVHREIDANSGANKRVSGIHLRCMNAANSGAGIDCIGGGLIEIDHCKLTGWRQGVVLDGTLDSCVHHCNFMADGCGYSGTESIGVWLVDGASRGLGWTVPGSTNAIRIHDCTFNAPATAIFDQGGTGHSVSDNVIVLGQVCAVRIQGPSNATYEDNVIEGDNIYYPSRVAVVHVTGAAMLVTWANNSIAHNRSLPCFWFDGAGASSWRIVGNFLQTAPGGSSPDLCSPIISGVVNLNGPLVVSGNHHPVQNMFASGGGGLQVQFANDIGPGGHIDGISLNGMSVPQAMVDARVRTYTKPWFILRDGNYITEQFQRFGPQKGTERHLLVSSDSGVGGEDSTAREWARLQANGGYADVARTADVPPSTAGTLVATVVGKTADTLQICSYELRQSFYRTGAGVVLVGSPTVTGCGAGFTAPGIVAIGNSLAVRLYANQDSQTQWSARLAYLTTVN